MITGVIASPPENRNLKLLEEDISITGALADVDFCRRIIEQLKAENVPCGLAEASRIGELITAAYPRMNPHSPDEYAKLICATIARFPKPVALEAMDRMTERMKFLPSRADVAEYLNEVMGERAKLARAAKAHLAEHQRRREEAGGERMRAESRAALKATLGPAWDAWWSIPITRRYSPTPEKFADGWRRATDKDAFCSAWGIQDGPE